MCGYWFANNSELAKISVENLKRRGPENFTQVANSLGNFSHSMLNTIGVATAQPLANRHGYLLYNGSTYNSLPDNDAKWLATQLDESPQRFVEVVQSLIGEYSITYVTDQHIMFCVDQFATRNLYFYYDQPSKSFACASTVDSVLEVYPGAVRAEENKIYIIDKSQFELKISENTKWNLNQTVNNYDSVFDAFETSVKNRHQSGITTYMLSGGFDIGVITCCAQKLFHNIRCVTRGGREDPKVLGQRLQLHKGILDRDDDSKVQSCVQHIYQSCSFEITRDSTSKAIASLIRNHFITEQQKICISGVGGDELYADYALDKSTGRLGKILGAWPSSLQTVFPWHNHQQTNLLKQIIRSDTVFGYHGIEARYPLLDQQLFQSWLNTSVRLKNRSYKDWMRCYMMEHDYPISEQKIGFTT